MMIISRTPVRISFFGGGTDYPTYYHRMQGAVLGVTINKYTYASVKQTLSNLFDYKIRISYSSTELINDIEHIQHPSIRECLKFLNLSSNLDIHIFSDLPARTGLGSSSSFTVGFLNALYTLQGSKISKQKLAEQSCYIEQQMIRENVGSQDQFHAAFGGLNLIEFNASSIRVKPIVISTEKTKLLEQHLMLFYTGLTRHASEILKEQTQKTSSQMNDAYLQDMLQIVYEAEDVLVNAKPREMIVLLGSLLHKGWELKKNLSSKISNSLIDDAYQRAKDAGAYGGKLCGAGSGGFLALLVPPHLQNHVKTSLSNLLQVDLQFEYAGSSIIYTRST